MNEIEFMEPCDFCEQSGDYGFDTEWDAVLCWECHLTQQWMLWFAKYRFRTFGVFL